MEVMVKVAGSDDLLPIVEVGVGSIDECLEDDDGVEAVVLKSHRVIISTTEPLDGNAQAT
jgi:hypothetical protein